MTEKQKTVLKVFEDNGQLTPHDAASRLGHNESAPIFDAIKTLVRRGLLEKSGKGKNTFYSIKKSKR